MRFVLDGIRRGERADQVLRSEYQEQHLHRLRGAGIDISTVKQCVAVLEQTYLRGGRFDPDAMLAFIEETLKAGTAQHFPLLV